MNHISSYIVPSVLLAVTVHALVGVVLAMNWNFKPSIEIAKVEPYYINAELVAQNPYTVKKEMAEKAANERARQQELERRRQLQEEQVKAERKKQEELRREELARQQARKEDQARLIQQATKEEQKEQSRVSEAERQKMEENLSLAVMHEQGARQAVTDDERAMAYVAQMKHVIIQNWSRPPSARNGMQTLLKVHLVPTGEVVDVTVVKSSGNDAFDRSAILAVQKSERFDVPSDSREFERNFREFEVLFRPEDLRL